MRPEVLVLLGATAAGAVLGPRFRLTTRRGELIEAAVGGGEAGNVTQGAAGTRPLPVTLATYHPSAVLRARDREARRTMYEMLVADLGTAWARASQ